jgi:hypothetical protein
MTPGNTRAFSEEFLETEKENLIGEERGTGIEPSLFDARF